MFATWNMGLIYRFSEAFQMLDHVSDFVRPPVRGVTYCRVRHTCTPYPRKNLAVSNCLEGTDLIIRIERKLFFPEDYIFDRRDWRKSTLRAQTCSSLCTYSFVMGSNSAVGVASRNDSSMGKSNSVFAYLKNPARSFLLIAPTLRF